MRSNQDKAEARLADLGPRNVTSKWCKVCKKDGHSPSECPMYVCFHCKRYGHFSKECDTCTWCYERGHHEDACPKRSGSSAGEKRKASGSASLPSSKVVSGKSFLSAARAKRNKLEVVDEFLSEFSPGSSISQEEFVRTKKQFALRRAEIRRRFQLELQSL